MRDIAAAGLLFAAALWLTSVCPMSSAASAQESRSLDDELFDQLGTDPIDDVDRELFGPGDQQGRAGDQQGKGEDEQGKTGNPPESHGESLQDRLQRELGAAGQAEDDNPLLTIARRMREAEGMIAESDSGSGTQKLQTQIVDDLDRLIQQARKRCTACAPCDKPSQLSRRSPGGQPRPKQGSGGKTPSNKPAHTADAKPRNDQLQQPDMQRMRVMMKQLWGELPQRDRERMLQSPPEEFLPQYELLIEEYFRRLTEQEKAGTTNGP